MPKQQLTAEQEEKVLDLREDIVRICQNLRIDASEERLKTIINAIQRALSLSINDPIIIDAFLNDTRDKILWIAQTWNENTEIQNYAGMETNDAIKHIKETVTIAQQEKVGESA